MFMSQIFFFKRQHPYTDKATHKHFENRSGVTWCEQTKSLEPQPASPLHVYPVIPSDYGQTDPVQNGEIEIYSQKWRHLWIAEIFLSVSSGTYNQEPITLFTLRSQTNPICAGYISFWNRAGKEQREKTTSQVSPVRFELARQCESGTNMVELELILIRCLQHVGLRCPLQGFVGTPPVCSHVVVVPQRGGLRVAHPLGVPSVVGWLHQ